MVHQQILDAKIPKCGSGTRPTSAHVKGKIHEGDCMLEEHQQEEGDHGNKEGPWQENWDVESKCVAGVEEVAGMPDEDWEPAQIKEGTEGVAVERLIQISAEAHRMETETVLDKLDLGSVTPFLKRRTCLDKKTILKRKGIRVSLNGEMGPPGVVLSLNGFSFGMYMRQF